MPWNTGLDPNTIAFQIAAAQAARVRVLAGPGTGKSFAMKRRVARLLEEGVEPDSILAVTFTRVAAEDLHRELQSLDVEGAAQLRASTLHSLALRLLRRSHVLEALGRIPRALNDFEVKALVADLAGAHGGARRCGNLIDAYSSAWARTQGDDPGFAHTPDEAAFEHDLVSWLTFHGGMLIGELIPYLVRYLHSNPHSPEHTEFQHLLVDEYQDLNKAEQAALAHLGANGHMCVVGDDDQSIYSFKHAHPDGIRQWPQANPGCQDLAMAECRRCPTRIVTVANALISHNVQRDPRVLGERPENGVGELEIRQFQTPDLEAAWISERVQGLIAAGVHPSEVIVLVQRNAVAAPIYQAVRDRGVPVKSYYDESQLNTPLAQARFALFKLHTNQEDRVALRYLLGYDHPAFQRAPYRRLREHCEVSGDSPWQALERLADGTLHLPYTGALRDRFIALRTELDQLADAETVAQLIDRLFPPGDEELAEVRRLAEAAAAIAGDDVSALMGEMMSVLSQPEIPPSVDEVRVMSLHKSKGLSAAYVFIAGCVEGILPPRARDGATPAERQASLEEARRLFFVGLTRAKADPANGRPGSVFITYPRTMPVATAHRAGVRFQQQIGNTAYLMASRFIAELGPAAPAPIAGGD